MTREDLAGRVCALISDHLAQTTGRRFAVTEPAELRGAELNFDSLDMVEITMEAEEQFDIALDDTLVSEMETVGDFVGHVEKQAGLCAASAPGSEAA